jgi:hypothetical protein
MSAFANAANKLGAPSKKSVFERQKEEAEARKAREKAETEAAYEDFVKSFEGDGDAPPQAPRPGHGSTGGGHGPGKRHFTSSGLKSGPGSLGAALAEEDPHSGRRDRSTTLPGGGIVIENVTATASLPTTRGEALMAARCSIEPNRNARTKKRRLRQDQRYICLRYRLGHHLRSSKRYSHLHRWSLRVYAFYQGRRQTGRLSLQSSPWPLRRHLPTLTPWSPIFRTST